MRLERKYERKAAYVRNALRSCGAPVSNNETYQNDRPGALFNDRPLLVPYEAVLLGQEPEVGELWEADWHTSADGLWGLEHRVLAEEQVILVETDRTPRAQRKAPSRWARAEYAVGQLAWPCSLRHVKR
jgi:hypothetical protein